MMPFRLLRFLRVLTLFVVLRVPGIAQPVPSPTDTSYVSTSLKKAQELENNKPQVALNYYQRAYEVAKRTGFTKGYFETIRLYAYTLNNVGRHADARRLGKEAVERAKSDTSNRHKSLGYFVLASTASFEGKLKEAVPFYQKAAEYLLRSDKPENVSPVYQNIGLIYEQQGLYPQALEYYNRALQIDLTDKDHPRHVAADYNSLGGIYLKQKKYALSKAYYLKARQLIDPEKDLDFIISLYNNIGYLFSAQTKYDSALHYLQEGLRLSRVMKNPRHELHMLMILAQTNTQMGRYQQARQLLNQSNAIAQRTNAGLSELGNIYREYIVANYGLEDYKAALGWMDKYMGVKDSLSNEDTKQLLQEYELKLKQAEAAQKLAEKQRQITQLEAQRKRQSLWLLVALLGVGVVSTGLGLGFLYYRQRQRTAANALLATVREGELAVVQSELLGQQKERLRISKEMHDDLGASLTAIGLLSEVMKTRMGAAATPEVEKISSISSEMMTSMNEIIWSLNTKNDNLNGLIAYIRAYASEFIDNTSLLLKTEVAESSHDISIRGADRRNVFLTVKEALNNVVKHAQATQVTLSIQPEPDQLRIEVRDNGRGISLNGKASSRNGLSNMNHRMAESGGTCVIASSSAGTCVQITYPYASVSAEKLKQNHQHTEPRN